MGKTSTHVTSGNKSKSELDKFKLFYEIATPTRKVRSRLQQQQHITRDSK